MPSRQPRILFDEDAISTKVQELAEEISRDYAGMSDLLLVGVLRGAFMFIADLSRRLTVARRVDFVALSSYEDQMTSSGAVRLVMDLRTKIAGMHVLIVDDIVDTGSTLDYLMKILASRHPASIRSCALIRKSKSSRDPIAVDYVGFEIENRWVVGYGLDLAGEWRALPSVGYVDVPDSS